MYLALRVMYDIRVSKVSFVIKHLILYKFIKLLNWLICKEFKQYKEARSCVLRNECNLLLSFLINCAFKYFFFKMILIYKLASDGEMQNKAPSLALTRTRKTKWFPPSVCPKNKIKLTKRVYLKLKDNRWKRGNYKKMSR